MNDSDHKEIFNNCIDDIRVLLVRVRHDFIKNNTAPIPGIFDSREIGFYVDGAMDILDIIDRTLELAYKMTKNETK